MNVLTCLLALLSSLLLSSCDKIEKKVENYDLFGLDAANEAAKMQQKKIDAARAYQGSMGTIRQDAYNSPNILGGSQ